MRASTSRFTAVDSSTRGSRPTAASRSPSRGPAGRPRRAARGATGSPRCPGRPGGTSRPARAGSAQPVRPSCRSAMQACRLVRWPGVWLWLRLRLGLRRGLLRRLRWPASRPVAGCSLVLGAWGAGCDWRWQARTAVAARPRSPPERGRGPPRAPAGPASGCGSAAEAVPETAEGKRAKARIGTRRPGAAERVAARLRMRGGAFCSKRFILLDLRVLRPT